MIGISFDFLNLRSESGSSAAGIHIIEGVPCSYPNRVTTFTGSDSLPDIYLSNASSVGIFYSSSGAHQGFALSYGILPSGRNPGGSLSKELIPVLVDEATTSVMFIATAAIVVARFLIGV